METQNSFRFDGADYVQARDNPRLTSQLMRVYSLMSDGQWRTLQDMALATGDPHASISAQLRHLRKDRFGAHTVERRYIDNGLYEYKLIVNTGGEICQQVN
jgi:hypothetical protein